MSEAGSARTGVLLGCAGLALLAVIGVVVFGWAVFGSIRSSAPYQVAMEEVRRNPLAREALGEPITEGFFVGGTVNVTPASGDAKLAIPVEGPKGAGDVHVEAVKRAGEWDITLLQLAPAGGPPIDLRPAASEALLARWCRGGNGDACNALGVRLANGEGVAKDVAAATGWFEKGCEAGGALACGNLGNIRLGAGGAPPDPARAAPLLERACDGGIARSCSELGVLHQRGAAVRRDAARAAALYGKACDGGYLLGCMNLGELHLRGNGVPEDQGRAAALFRKACDGGEADACARGAARAKD